MTLAVGSNRHYVVNTIVGRHFLQTARSCGLADRLVEEIIVEILNGAAKSIDQAVASTAGQVPEALQASIINGLRARLKLLPLPDGED